MTSNTPNKRLSVDDWSNLNNFRGHLSKRFENHCVSLCIALQQNPSSFDGKKLSLVGTSLSVLDTVPISISRGIYVLYLSNNNLLSLKGIEQFVNVRCLSCGHNLIRYIGELQYLRNLRELEKVSLDGNVVTSMPYYREYILLLCPKVEVIDGVKVSSQERLSSQASARKAQTFYEQLRLNELRNCVLEHIFNLLKCHSLLLSVVLGRFRSLRGAHLPVAPWGGSRFGATEFGSIGAILRQCLLGGVFRWLQIASVDDFDRAVQERAHKAHIIFLRKMSRAERTALAQSTTAQSLHWDSVTADCLHYQQTMCLDLMRECESIAAARFGMLEEFAERGHEACRGSMNFLQQVNFDSQPSSSAELQLAYCGIGAYCTSYTHTEGSAVPLGIARRVEELTTGEPGLIPGRILPSPVLEYGKDDGKQVRFKVFEKSRRCEDSFENGGQKENRIVSPQRNGNILRRKDGRSVDSTQCREDLQDKYEALLKQMQGHGGRGPVALKAAHLTAVSPGAGTVGGQVKSLSFFLPPQQQEPLENATPSGLQDGREIEDELVETARVESGSTKSDFDPFSEEISSFIQRARLPFLEQLPHWYQSVSDALLAAAATADRGIAQSEAGRAQLWGPVPIAFSRPGADKSMRAMKTTAEVALGELARRQRAEMLCSEANDRLRRGVEDARVALREHLHTALGHLNEDRTDVEAFSNDIEQGCDWVGMSSGLLGTIEAEVSRKEDMESAVALLQHSHREYKTQIDSLTEEIAEIEKAIREVVWAQQAVDDDMIGDGVMADSIRQRTLTDQATDFLSPREEKRSKKLLADTFICFRLRIRRQRRIKDFSLSLKRKHGREILSDHFSGWWAVVQISLRAMRQVAWSRKRAAEKALRAWRRVFSYRQRLVLFKTWQRRLRIAQGLVQWLRCVHWRRSHKLTNRVRASKLQKAFVHYVFRAWRRYTQACLPVHTLLDVTAVIRAGKFRTLRVFERWKQLAESGKAVLSPVVSAVAALHKRNVLVFYLRQWAAIASAVRWRKRRALHRAVAALQSFVCRRRGVTAVRQRGNRRFKAVHRRKLWKWWRLWCKRRKYARLVGKKIRLSSRWRTLMSRWSIWLSAFEVSAEFRKKDLRAMLHFFNVSLQRTFLAWQKIVFGDDFRKKSTKSGFILACDTADSGVFVNGEGRALSHSLQATHVSSATVPASKLPTRMASVRTHAGLSQQAGGRGYTASSISSSSNECATGGTQEAQYNTIQPIRASAGETVAPMRRGKVTAVSRRWEKICQQRQQGPAYFAQDSDSDESDVGIDQSLTRRDERLVQRNYFRTLLSRWNRRTKKKRHLHDCNLKVSALVERNRKRRWFAVVFAVYAASTQRRSRLTRAALEEAEDVAGERGNGSARREQLFQLFSKARDKTLDLQRRLDFVAVQVTRLSSDVDSARLSVADVDTSLATVRAELDKTRKKKRELTGQIESIHVLCENSPHRNREGLPDSALPLDSLGDALTPSDALHATDKVLDKQLHSTFTEKKQALMFDVETVYNTAVQLKSDALRKHTQLSFEQRDATQRLVAVRAEYARLEMQIKQLESRRQQAEVAREAVTAAVHSSLQSIKTTTEQHKEAEDELAAEETHLRATLVATSDREASLRTDLESLRSAVLMAQQVRAKFQAPPQQATSELEAVDLYSASRAASVGSELHSRNATHQQALTQLMSRGLETGARSHGLSPSLYSAAAADHLESTASPIWWQSALSGSRDDEGCIDQSSSSPAADVGHDSMASQVIKQASSHQSHSVRSQNKGKSSISGRGIGAASSSGASKRRQAAAAYSRVAPPGQSRSHHSPSQSVELSPSQSHGRRSVPKDAASKTAAVASSQRHKGRGTNVSFSPPGGESADEPKSSSNSGGGSGRSGSSGGSSSSSSSSQSGDEAYRIGGARATGSSSLLAPQGYQHSQDLDGEIESLASRIRNRLSYQPT